MLIKLLCAKLSGVFLEKTYHVISLDMIYYFSPSNSYCHYPHLRKVINSQDLTVSQDCLTFWMCMTMTVSSLFLLIYVSGVLVTKTIVLPSYHKDNVGVVFDVFPTIYSIEDNDMVVVVVFITIYPTIVLSHYPPHPSTTKLLSLTSYYHMSHPNISVK